MSGFAFIVGCARSGTSILGELVASHPSVRYIWEAHRVWALGGGGVNGSERLTARHATPDVTMQIREWFSQQSVPAKLTVEKTPRNVIRVPYVRAIFPEAKIIFIVRDGRDVACSMVPGCGGETWRHLKPPSWQELAARYQGALRCAHAWKEIMEIALADLHEVPHLRIRYEDMVVDPRSVAAEVLEYLELPPSSHVMSFCSRIQDSTTGSYHAERQTRWYRDNHKTRVGRWRENLTNKEQDEIHPLLASLLARLGYAP